MKYQRGVAMSGLLLWSLIIIVLAVFSMKVVPSVIVYYKTLKDIRAVSTQASPDASVADIRKAYEKYADIDVLELPSSQLDISKNNGKVVIEFNYEKRIPLLANVSLLIDYKGSSAE